MATFGEMKTWVSKRILDPNNTAVSLSDVGDTINQAIDYWKNTRFYFNEVSDSGTLTQGDPTISLPATWLFPSIDDSFVIEYSGMRYPLKKVSESFYNSVYLSNGNGQPKIFSRQANLGFQVYPIPDRDYTVRRFFLKDYDVLSATGDENDWTTSAYFLTAYTAASYCARDFRHDSDMANNFETSAKKQYDDLMASTRRNNATGSLTLFSFLT